MTLCEITFAGQDVMAAGTIEPEDAELVRKLLKEVDMLVNVGANVGYSGDVIKGKRSLILVDIEGAERMML